MGSHFRSHRNESSLVLVLVGTRCHPAVALVQEPARALGLVLSRPLMNRQSIHPKNRHRLTMSRQTIHSKNRHRLTMSRQTIHSKSRHHLTMYPTQTVAHQQCYP